MTIDFSNNAQAACFFASVLLVIFASYIAGCTITESKHDGWQSIVTIFVIVLGLFSIAAVVVNTAILFLKSI